MSESFSDKLVKLLKNKEFKKYVDTTIEDESDIDFKEFKQELEKTKIKEAKDKRFKKLNEKRYGLKKEINNQWEKNKKNEINNLLSDEDEAQSQSIKDKTSNKENDDHPNIFFLKKQMKINLEKE